MLNKLLTYSAKILLLCLVFIGSLDAQVPPSPNEILPPFNDNEFSTIINQWNKRDGLPTREIYCLFMDSSGLLWLGTDQGLYNFDGYKFYQIPSKGINNVSQIVEDNQKNIWFVNNNKREISINIWNPSTATFIDIKGLTPLKSPERWFLYKHKEGLRILNTKGEQFNYNIQLKTLPKLKFPADIHEKRIYPSKNGAVWIHDSKSGNSISLLNNKSQVLQKHKLKDISKAYFWQDQNLNLWAAYGDAFSNSKPRKNNTYKLIKIKKAGIQHYSYLQMPVSAWMMSAILPTDKMIVNTYGTMWFVNKNHAQFLYQNRTIPISISKEYGTPNPALLLPAIDGSFWTANTEALLKFEVINRPFTTYLNDEKSANSIRGISMGKDGNLYVNSNKGGRKINLPTGQAKTFSFKESTLGMAILADEDYIWISKPSGLVQYFYNGKTNYFPFPGNSRTNINAILKTSKNQIFVGTANGLYTLDKEREKLIPHSLRGITIECFYENKEGIWAGTRTGVYLLNTDGIQSSHMLPAGEENDWVIQFIHQDKEGHFWLASENGLIHWNKTDNSYKRFTQVDGLSSLKIHAIYEDKNETLWLPSDFGLMAFNKKNKSIRTYFDFDGLPHNEFNKLAHFQDKSGRLYFGGINGLVSFAPATMHSNEVSNLPLNLVMCSVKNGKTGKTTDMTANLNREKTVTLSPDENFVDLALSSYVYKNDMTVEFGWQIKGKQKDWVFQNSNTILLNNIDYGKNILEIKCRNLGGDWSRNVLILTIIRLQPFYLRWSFLVGFFLATILLLLLYFKRRTRKLKKDKAFLEKEVENRTAQIRLDKQTIEKQAEELKILDKTKTRFFANITHEFRTPLTLIIGPVEQVMSDKISPKIKSKLNGVLRNGQHLLRLINQLLDISKLESGAMKQEVSLGDLIAFVNDLVLRFQPMAQLRQQRLIFIPNTSSWETHFDKGKLNKIMFNLVSNALKYTPEKGVIQVFLSKKQGIESSIEIIVKDTGVGISPKIIPHIFDRFFQVDSSLTRKNEGTGIGLALVKELVEFQGGQISVESELEKGTTFTVILPLLAAPVLEYTKEEAIPTALFQTFEPIQTLDVDSNTDKNKLELLIIEDNKEMSTYIRQCVGTDNYNVLTAENGEIGLRLTLEHIPDIIICDVMMPVKDGFEVTKAIRTNINTSHIPLILLSAKTSLDSRLKGLERGADAYLTKPFSPQELSLRIRKLIETRHFLQLRFKSGEQNQEDDSLPFTKEYSFIKKTQSIVSKHLDSNELTPEFLAKALLMSRMNLHRKLKAITNQTTSEFIRGVRLDHAFKLLKSRQGTIAEIAYQTGFSSPSYFSKAFKAKFDISPSEVEV